MTYIEIDSGIQTEEEKFFAWLLILLNESLVY